MIFAHVDFEVPDFGELASGPIVKPDCAPLVLSMQPVAYWRLGETAGPTVIDAAGDSHGTPTGGCTLGVEGALAWDGDRAIELDGSDGHVELGPITLDHPLQLAGSDVTIAAWFYQSSGGDRYQRILDKSTAGAGRNGYAVWADPEARSLAIQLDNYFSTADGVYRFDTWHHAAFVITAAEYRIYLDGSLLPGVWQYGSAAQPPASAANARLGAWNHATGRQWKGRLDELAVWNHALTQTQITQLYRTGAGR